MTTKPHKIYHFSIFNLVLTATKTHLLWPEVTNQHVLVSVQCLAPENPFHYTILKLLTIENYNYYEENALVKNLIFVC